MNFPKLFFCLSVVAMNLDGLGQQTVFAQAAPADGPPVRTNICRGLEPLNGNMNELYYRTRAGLIAPLQSATMEDVRGRSLELCYVVARTENDLSEDSGRRGAFNFRVEIVTEGNPNDRDAVGLYNNRNRTSACKWTEFDPYQRFHEDERRSYSCLKRDFHNGESSGFPTLDYRSSFLFGAPPRLAEGQQVKRQSMILNYSVPADYSTVRVPINVTIAREATRVEFHLNDLLKTAQGWDVPSVRGAISR